jgi:hypothetical protein
MQNPYLTVFNLRKQKKKKKLPVPLFMLWHHLRHSSDYHSLHSSCFIIIVLKYYIVHQANFDVVLQIPNNCVITVKQMPPITTKTLKIINI